MVYVPALIASFLAILIEKKGRRGTLSLYMTNLVSNQHIMSLCHVNFLQVVM